MPNKPTYEELERRIWELEQSKYNQQRNVEQLIPSQNLMDYIISHAPIAITVFDRDFKYIYVSKRYLKDYNIKEENVIGRYHYEVFPDIPKKWKDVHRRSLAGEVLSSEEDPYYRSDGSIEWTHWECRPWYESDGSIGGIVIYNEIINERMKIEEKMRRSEKLLSTHLLNTPVGAVSWDLEFKAIEWNPAAKLIFGYTREEAIGQHITKLIPPEDVKKLVNGVFQDLFAGTGGKRNVNKNITKSGKRILCDWYNTVLKNPAGDIIGMASLINDITDRKRSQDINKTLFAISNAVNTTKNLPDLYKQIHNLLGRIIDVTNFFIAIVNEKEHTLYFPYYVDTVDDDFSPLTDFNPQESLTGLVVSTQKPLLLKKNKLQELADKRGVWGPVPLTWMGVPLVVKDEIKGVIVVQSYTDSDIYTEQDLEVLISISDQVAVAIDRKRTENELSRSEEKFRTAFKTSPHIITLTKIEDGVYVDINDTFTKLLGYSPEEIIGKSSIELNIWNDLKDRDRLVSGLNDAGLVENLQADFKGKEGQSINGQMSARILDIDNKEYLLAVTQDITEFKNNENKRLDLETQLQQAQKMESIGTLAGGIAHDFNNILFPIVGHTEMLLEDISKDSPFREGLSQIYTGAMRASELVKQILTFSRQDANELKLMKMQPIIKEALKLIRSTIPTTIEIKQDIHPDCGVIKADPTQIHQITMNLATNAYHAMEKTGGELKVRLKEIKLGGYDVLRPDMKPGNYACLTIADTGLGMDKQLIRSIFDPFFTTKEKGKGTGMGLSVVHGIVENMNGAIQVYSEPGEGTQFHLYLPVEKNFSEKQVTHLKVEIQGGTEQILLVDDEEAILTMEKKMLERLGYQVTSRTSSIEALETFRAVPNKFDLVITDMAMPNIPGDKLSAELTKIRPDIPVLLCTGFSETMSEEKAASLGIKGFLLKPIVMKDLAKKIRDMLARKTVR